MKRRNKKERRGRKREERRRRLILFQIVDHYADIWSSEKTIQDDFHLQDLNEAWKHRVPAHSDQRHIWKHLWDYHWRQGGHWRSVVGTSSYRFSSCVFSPGLRTFSAVFREARAAGHVPEQPALDLDPWSGAP